MGNLNPVTYLVYLGVLIVLTATFAPPICFGLTDPRDVVAINTLFVALGTPPLNGWIPNGGDPCTEGWKGVLCVNANITGIVLNGMNLGGELGDLGLFPSIIQLDLSNNHIGGIIPSSLPVTMRSFYLSGNQLVGPIPDTLSSSGQLSDLLLNNNHLTGIIPDAFQQLTGLTNLDLSGNALTGQLPPSMANLLNLNTLHLQDNLLSGILDVLQDLPLRDLNIENNLFFGPIPPKLLGVPNFRRAGNPFNTSVIPSPPASSPSLSPFGAPPPEVVVPGKQINGPSVPSITMDSSSKGQKFMTTKKLMWFAIAGLLILIALALAVWLIMSRCCKEKRETDEFAKMHEMKQNPSRNNESLVKPHNHLETVPREPFVRPMVGAGNVHRRTTSISETEDITERKTTAIPMYKEDHREIDMSGFDLNIQAPPPPPNFPPERVIAKPGVPLVPRKRRNSEGADTSRTFTIASLQQYTNSFSQENLIGEGVLGTVYRAELPDGKLLAVKKLDLAASKKQSDEDFLELVFNISKIQHPNIVEFVGYCAEHGQQLLVHQYCTNGTLHEALHLEDEIHKKLSWNARVRVALQAAQALEYLHEFCQPPIVHKNFKSANILLDDKLNVRVSDCGLAPLIPSNYITQVQGSGYGGSELESGSYTYQSDVYSFGVVMLELITGRKSHDRSRPRGEQYLVRWAIHRLHDIDALSRMVDPFLHGTYPSKSLSRFADIISSCLQSEPEFRPPMSEIVQNLVYMTKRDA